MRAQGTGEVWWQVSTVGGPRGEQADATCRGGRRHPTKCRARGRRLAVPFMIKNLQAVVIRARVK